MKTNRQRQPGYVFGDRHGYALLVLRFRQDRSTWDAALACTGLAERPALSRGNPDLRPAPL